MNKWSKVILPTVLAIAMVAPISAYAHNGGKPGQQRGHGKPSLAQQTMAKPAHNKPQDCQKTNHKHGHRKGLVNSPIGKGKMNEMKKTFFTLLVEKYSPETLADWQTTIAESEKLHTEIKAIIKANPELKATLKPQHTDDLKAKMEENKTIRTEFQAAVKAQDAAKIKSSLASILTKIKARNTVLATKLVELQKAVANKPVETTPTTDPAVTPVTDPATPATEPATT